MAGQSALVLSVFVMRKLSRAVEGSSHSDELPQLIVIVFYAGGGCRVDVTKRCSLPALLHITALGIQPKLERPH